LASSKQWSARPQSQRYIHSHCTRHFLSLHHQQCYYDFKYDDEDTVLNEIEEFYSYVEMPQATENLKAWEGSFQGGMGFSSCLLSPELIKHGKNGPKVSCKSAELMWRFYSRVWNTRTSRSDSRTRGDCCTFCKAGNCALAVGTSLQ
jgi:hypothetical protein